MRPCISHQRFSIEDTQWGTQVTAPPTARHGREQSIINGVRELVRAHAGCTSPVVLILACLHGGLVRVVHGSRNQPRCSLPGGRLVVCVTKPALPGAEGREGTRAARREHAGDAGADGAHAEADPGPAAADLKPRSSARLLLWLWVICDCGCDLWLWLWFVVAVVALLAAIAATVPARPAPHLSAAAPPREVF